MFTSDEFGSLLEITFAVNCNTDCKYPFPPTPLRLYKSLYLENYLLQVFERVICTAPAHLTWSRWLQCTAGPSTFSVLSPYLRWLRNGGDSSSSSSSSEEEPSLSLQAESTKMMSCRWVRPWKKGDCWHLWLDSFMFNFQHAEDHDRLLKGHRWTSCGWRSHWQGLMGQNLSETYF